MLLHKPLNYKSGIYKISKGFPPFTNNLNKNKILLSKSTDNSIPGEGTLLTGDIGFTQITNSNYIRQQLKNLGVFQVPHHGSKVGWNKQKLKELNPNIFTIINFGFGNLYGHPNETVLQDLKNERFDIRFVNQFEHFEYEFILIY